MKGLVILADGFEDVEALGTIDILRRAGIILDLAYLNKKDVISSHNVHFVFDLNLKDVNYKEYDFLFLPGGPAVFKTLHNEQLVNEIVYYYGTNKKEIYSICAAPSLVGKFGFFENMNYTCFPSCEGPISKGNKVNDGVVVANNFISAKSMYYTIDFAIAIINKLLGSNKANEVLKEIKGEK